MNSAGFHLSIFILLLFFQRLFGKFFRFRTIGFLGGFVPAAQRDDKFRTGIFVLDQVAGTVMDTHFRQPFADGGGIAGVSFGQPFNPFYI
jgi:hypothetical protein